MPPLGKPYRTKPHPMGLRNGLAYDKVSELLAYAGGDEAEYGGLAGVNLVPISERPTYLLDSNDPGRIVTGSGHASM